MSALSTIIEKVEAGKPIPQSEWNRLGLLSTLEAAELAEGELVAAAKMQEVADKLAFESLGVSPAFLKEFYPDGGDTPDAS